MTDQKPSAIEALIAAATPTTKVPRSVIMAASDELDELRAELEASRAELADAIATEELHAAHDKKIIDRLQAELAALRAQEPEDYWLDGNVIRKGREYVAEIIGHDALLLRELLTGKRRDKGVPPAVPAEQSLATIQDSHQSTVPAEVARAVDILESVLCNLGGKCCIRGSDGDRSEVGAALDILRGLTPAPAAPAVPDDVARLDFLIRDGAKVSLLMTKDGERHFVEWPELEEWQREAYMTPRDAIDAAMLAAVPAEQSLATIQDSHQPAVPPAVQELASILYAVRGVMMDAHNRAFPVCCGRGRGGECCGSPDPDWSKEDQAIMEALAPVERNLMKLLAAAQKGESK